MPKSNFFQFAWKTETTPGTAESLAGSDVKVVIFDDAQPNVETEFSSVNEVTAYGSKRPGVPTISRVRFSNIRYQLRGPGTALAVPSAVPAIKQMWAAGLMKGHQARLLDTNTDSIVFKAGEIVTFTNTPAHRAIVLEDVTTTNGGTIHVAFLTAADTAPSALADPEEIVGASGQTCASNGVLTAGGYAFLPSIVSNDAAGFHGTGILNRGGYAFYMRGGLSDLEWSIDIQGSIIVKQDFLGGLGTNPGDLALYTTSIPELSVVPPRASCPHLTIGGYEPECQGVTIQKPNGIDTVTDFNTCLGGVRFASEDPQEPRLSVTVAQVSTATKNYFTSLIGGGTEVVKLTVGSAAGSTWKFIFPAAQLQRMDPSSVSPNRAAFDLDFLLTGTENNEIIIIQE